MKEVEVFEKAAKVLGGVFEWCNSSDLSPAYIFSEFGRQEKNQFAEAKSERKYKHDIDKELKVEYTVTMKIARMIMGNFRYISATGIDDIERNAVTACVNSLLINYEAVENSLKESQ